MSSEKQETQLYNIDPLFEKYSRIGGPNDFEYLCNLLVKGSNSLQSIQLLAQSDISKRAIETKLSVILLSAMGLIEMSDDSIVCIEQLRERFDAEESHFQEWFVDEFVKYVMDNEIIDIETITYEIASDSFVMSPSSIKRKYAGFRNMLVEFEVIAMRSDAHYTILKKLDNYLARPEVRRKITEKQLYVQLQQRKEMGNKGEEWVLDFEKRRITNPNLRPRIKRISTTDVSAGFDIISFDSNNSTDLDRLIEVKTFQGNEHFHWSHNEIEKATLYGEHYYIYLVDVDCLDCEDYEPQMIQDPIKHIGVSDEWAKRPDSYLVERTLEAKEGRALPLFTNVKEFNQTYIHPTLTPYSPPSIEIKTPEIKISAGFITTEMGARTQNMVADTYDNGHSKTETTDSWFKTSLELLFDSTNYRDKVLFDKKSHWVAIFRVAVDEKLTSENDYKGFVEYVKGLHLKNCTNDIDYESLKKADVGVYQRPVSEWTFEKYQQLNMNKTRKPFDDMLKVAKKFKNLLDSNRDRLRNG